MKNRFKSIFSTNKDQRMNILGVLIMAAFVFFVGLSVYNIFIDLEENSTSGGQFTFEIIQPSSYNERLIIKLFGQEFSIMPIGALTAKAQTVGENIIQYIDAFPNTDVVQTREKEKLKEDIVLKQPGHPKEFAYQIDLTFYDFEKDKEGNFIFYVKGKKGKQLYRVFDIPAPFLIDADNKRSSAKEVETSLNNQGLLTLRPSEKWLAGAKYPVILDPTVEIVVLNIHSHPQQGENWEVEFSTKGATDLKIIPNDQATINDDEFISLSCDGEKRDPQILAGDVIFYPNWSCAGNGKVIHYTKKAGNHVLRFEFGDQITYAYNSSTPTGGDITTDGDYTIHSFKNVGTSSFVVPDGLSGNIEILVVAGGGSGGTWLGGGGGGGGVIYEPSYAVTARTYLITVGDGGAKMTGDGQGNNGEDSVFDLSGTPLTAKGGGGGGRYTGSGSSGSNGGSGGGAGGDTSGIYSGGTGEIGQGYNGGANANNSSGGGGGGGGGAGEAGQDGGIYSDGYPAMWYGGKGGDGLPFSISGSLTYYGGGGGGVSNVPDSGVRPGGAGGGGSSADQTHHCTAGVANTGGGGGGGYYANWSPPDYGEAGGSGVVIIRYLISDFDVRILNRVIFRTSPARGATGGTITINGDYTIHTFNSSGAISFPKAGNVSVLVVGGGGGGGDNWAGGGGGGGVVYEASHAVNAQSYSITVGGGGVGASSGDGGNGENSVFDNITAVGGGGGGGSISGGGTGNNGGSGGGGQVVDGTGGSGTVGQGYDGGDALGTWSSPYYGAAGGGGAGEVGEDGQPPASGGGGNGGDGLAYDISGVSTYYGGGGGGGGVDSYTVSAGDGGLGGGGNGGYNTAGENGDANTGGGGGGGNYADGGNGGSGIVIIKYLTSDFSDTTNSIRKIIFRTTSLSAPAGGTITTDGDYTVHTFTSDGTMTFFKGGNVEVLVVGGGGGGGEGNGSSWAGSGGGAGGVLYHPAKIVTAQEYSVIVGSGGASHTKGEDSVFDDLTAYGGGKGLNYEESATPSLADGGSGGGGRYNFGSGGSSTQINMNGATGYGHKGGDATAGDISGSGGGAGADGTGYYTSPNGGDGLDIFSDLLIAANAGVDISGTHWIAGGGAALSGTGGKGGGGVGGSSPGVPGGDGTENTGGGGGGCFGGPGLLGGAGGSGIVIIRYLTSDFLNSGSPVIFKTGVSL